MEGLAIKHKSSVGTGLLTICLVLPVAFFLNYMIALHHGPLPLLQQLQQLLIIDSQSQDENSLQPVTPPQGQEAEQPVAMDIAAQQDTTEIYDEKDKTDSEPHENTELYSLAQSAVSSNSLHDALSEPAAAKAIATGVNANGDEQLPTLLFNQPLTETLIAHWLESKQAYIVCQSASQIWYVWKKSPGDGHFSPFYEQSTVAKNISQREVLAIPSKLRARLHRQFYQEYSGECPVSLRLSVGLDNQIAQQQRALKAQSGKSLPQTVFEIQLTETGKSVFNYIDFSAK